MFSLPGGGSAGPGWWLVNFPLDGAWFYFTMKYCVVVVFRQILFDYKYVLENSQ